MSICQEDVRWTLLRLAIRPAALPLRCAPRRGRRCGRDPRTRFRKNLLTFYALRSDTPFLFSCVFSREYARKEKRVADHSVWIAAIEVLDCVNMAICTIGNPNVFRDLATRTVDWGCAKPQKSGRLRADSVPRWSGLESIGEQYSKQFLLKQNFSVFSSFFSGENFSQNFLHSAVDFSFN